MMTAKREIQKYFGDYQSTRQCRGCMENSSEKETEKQKKSLEESKVYKTPEVLQGDKATMNFVRSQNPDQSTGSAWQDKTTSPPHDYQSIQITGMEKPIARISKEQSNLNDRLSPDAKSVSKMELAHMQAQGDKTAEAFAHEYEKITQSLSRNEQALALADLQDKMDKTYGRGKYYSTENSHDSTDRPIYPKVSVEQNSRLITSGLEYRENLLQSERRTMGEKLSDFIKAAETRASDQSAQHAYLQGQLEKIIGIAEGMNNAKEEIKNSAKNVWNALTDGTVSSFLKQPDAINTPLFLTLNKVLDAFERDPNTVNKAFVLLGHQIELASEHFDSLSQREQGKVLGEIVFNNFGEIPKSDSLSESLSQLANENIVADSQLSKQTFTGDGFLESHSVPLLSDTGAGGSWPRLNERAAADVVRQHHRLSCVSACGEMLTSGEVKQADLIERLGRYELGYKPGDIRASSPVYLANELGEGWSGKAVGAGKLQDLLELGQNFAIELKEFRNIPHLVIAEGLDQAGNIMICDPWDATRYEMRPSDLAQFFTGRVCFKK